MKGSLTISFKKGDHKVISCSSDLALGVVYALECLRDEGNEYEFWAEGKKMIPCGMPGDLGLAWEIVS